MRIPGRLVVRTYAPARRYLMLGAALLLAAAAFFLSYELGRHQAGFDGIAAARERASLEDRIADLENQAHELRVQQSASESAQVAQGRERTELAATIGELQASLGRAQQDLEFYRAIANPQAARNAVVRVQQFQVHTDDAATHAYTLRFALNRPTRPEESTSGVLVISVDGERGGAAASLDLATLTGGKLRQLPYSFRYYTNIEQQLSLPGDFRPERVTFEIRPARSGVAPYRQSFVWIPDAQ